ncbi:hypothetical protein PsorP6_003678 [Peronosclerospora sorghi]|uniref:Uncharacterized protein n=1 Tax=Peronosclerospora sorghi TaxID=230839 RepID=A0ACC0VKN9_9STRA|nr:hypothetical protein PsorP6_003678 [Peronosclerospora sorghi]
MNELTPTHPAAPHSQSRTPYAFSANANVVNLTVMDRKSIQGVSRSSANLVTAKYQSHPQPTLQHVNEYHAGLYAPQSSSQFKTSAENRSAGHSGGKFGYTSSSQQYQPHPAPQQSYAASYGYTSFEQNFSSTENYTQQQEQQHQQSSQQQQQYHGAYAQVGETNPLGMLVSSATNPHAAHDAMPHDHVNIGLKDAGDRKFRQPYSIVPTDSFLNSSAVFLHGIERPGNVVQLKTTPSSSHQQPMYQRSNVYGGGTAYYSQQQHIQQQQRTHDTSQQHNSLDLVPTSVMGGSFDNGGATSNAGRGLNSGVSSMFISGPRMPQFSPGASGTSLTTRLKDEGVDISTGASSSGSHIAFMQQKSLELPHSTSLYADVANSTTSMSMVSLSSDGPATASINANALYPPSLAPPPSQLNSSNEDTCGLCSGTHSDRIASHCGHRFHAQCLHTWGGLTTCPICAQQGSTVQGDVTLSSGGPNNNSGTNASTNAVSISSNSVGSSQVATVNNVQLNNNVAGGRPPPIDTRILDNRLGPTTLSGGKHSASSTRSGSGSGGRVRKNKKLKDCSVPGCDRTVRSRGLCKGHGGGRRCGFAGCGLSDQGGGFCISHGGGKRCQHEGCDNSAQSRGLCKLHGGGSRCTVLNCTKSSQGRGLCRAHGGGRRCMVEGCNKTDRRAGYCVTHGADKKCLIPECSKTGRIDNMCTKHYFERHPAQPPGTVSTTPPPIITVNANTSAARARAERTNAVEQQVAINYASTSSLMLAESVPTPHAPFDGRISGAITKTEPF